MNEPIIEEEQEDRELTRTFQPPVDQGARWAGDYSLLLWEIKARLRGGHLDQTEKGLYKIVVPKGAIPFMNDKGIENTMAVLNGFITKVQKYSIYENDRILEWCKEVDWALCKLYFANMDAYELTPDKADIVVRMIMSMYESNMRSSIEGQALVGLNQSEKIVESRIPQQPNKKWFGVV